MYEINISRALSTIFTQTRQSATNDQIFRISTTEISQTTTIGFTCRCYRNPVIHEQAINYVEYCIIYSGHFIRPYILTRIMQYVK